MNKLARAAFPVAFAITVIATFASFANPALIPFSWLMGGYIVSTVLGGLHPGDKTRLQYIFLSIGALLATCSIAFAWGWGGWVGVGLCAFMVLTMKIDGGDGYGG